MGGTSKTEHVIFEVHDAIARFVDRVTTARRHFPHAHGALSTTPAAPPMSVQRTAATRQNPLSDSSGLIETGPSARPTEVFNVDVELPDNETDLQDVLSLEDEYMASRIHQI